MNLPTSELICPRCGIGVVHGILDHESGIHKYCILLGIRNGFYLDLNGWLAASKNNYDLVVSFFKLNRY